MNAARTTGILFALSPALLLTGCGSFSKQSVGLKQVDKLVGRVERVHVECELSKERVRESLEALRVVVQPNFKGDPVEAFAEFEETIAASTKQADKVRACLEPMQEAAAPFFDQWAADMEGFSSAKMRQRSEARMAATRARYNAVVTAFTPVLTSYDVFNQGLQDHALFLGHDLNPAAISDIEGAVRGMAKLAVDLDQKLDTCLEAAETYVRAAALPGHVATEKDEAPRESISSDPEPSRARGRYRR